MHTDGTAFVHALVSERDRLHFYKDQRHLEKAAINKIFNKLPAGLKGHSKVLVLGSKASEVQRVLNSHDLPGMAGFDHELKTLAARRKRVTDQAVQLPTGASTA